MYHQWRNLPLFTKNTWIGDSSTLCHIIDDDVTLFNVTKIYKSVERNSSSMPATKKGKLLVNICQVNNTEWVHTLWPVKSCPKEDANLFSLTCKLLQGNNRKSDQQNNILAHSSEGNTILDCCINNHDS